MINWRSARRTSFYHLCSSGRAQGRRCPVGDLPKFVDFNYVAQVAPINAASLGALARAPAALWRETSAPLWQQTVSAGNVTRFTVPKISKDDYLFGVAAVDQDGNRSSAVYPAPLSETNFYPPDHVTPTEPK